MRDDLRAMTVRGAGRWPCRQHPERRAVGVIRNGGVDHAIDDPACRECLDAVRHFLLARLVAASQPSLAPIHKRSAVCTGPSFVALLPTTPPALSHPSGAS